MIKGLEREIIDNHEKAKIIKELYQLVESYNAYSILLLKLKEEYDKANIIINRNYLNSNCYENQIDGLFSLFKDNECLQGQLISHMFSRDKLFLIDQDTLLRMNSFENMNSNIGGLSHIGYKLFKIDDCRAKVYEESVYCGDPYYCDSHFEKRPAFTLSDKNNLIMPGYVLDDKMKSYNNMDIREILKVQSLDEIHDKISQAQNEKKVKLLRRINYL